MNVQPKNRELLEKPISEEIGDYSEGMLYLIDTDIGKAFDERMSSMRKFCAENFGHEDDPLWPKFGDNFKSDLFEAVHRGDDEFLLVWRDVLFAYYKRFGRSTYISRELTDDEVTQFFMELQGVLTSLVANSPPVDKMGKYRPDPIPTPNTPGGKLLHEAAALVKAYDEDPANALTLNQRRTLLGEKRGYAPALGPVISPTVFHELIAMLDEEGIPK